MKIAYLLSGLVGGLSGKNFERQDDLYVPTIANYCKKTIDNFFCKECQIDFYIFTWHANHATVFEKIYQPKEIICQEQISFPLPQCVENTPRSQAHVSRWYGYKKVFEKFEERTIRENLNYDFVVSARFDICWNKNISINDTSKVLLASYISKEESPEHFPSKNPIFNIDKWGPAGYGKLAAYEVDLPDHIFGGDFNTMKHMSTIYDNIWHLHDIKKYGRGRMMSHHRLLPGMIKEMKKNQKDIDYLSYIDYETYKADYDIFRYRKLTIEKLGEII